HARCPKPRAARLIANGAREKRKTAASDPETTEANRSAAAAPAPSPTKTIWIISSCPASSAVRDGTGPSQPFHRERRRTEDGKCASECRPSSSEVRYRIT